MTITAGSTGQPAASAAVAAQAQVENSAAYVSNLCDWLQVRSTQHNPKTLRVCDVPAVCPGPHAVTPMASDGWLISLQTSAMQSEIDEGRRALHQACKHGFASGLLLAMRYAIMDVPLSGGDHGLSF